MRTTGPNRLRGELAGNELRTRKEYVSDRDAGFKQPLERCKLLTRWAFKYFDQTLHDRRVPVRQCPPILPGATLPVLRWRATPPGTHEIPTPKPVRRARPP